MDTYYAQSTYSDWNHPTITPVIPGLVSNSYYGLVDINLAYVDFRYATDRLKIRLVPAFGSYMDKNYSGTNTLNNLMEGRKLFNQLYWRTECKWWQSANHFTGIKVDIFNAITSLGLGF